MSEMKTPNNIKDLYQFWLPMNIFPAPEEKNVFVSALYTVPHVDGTYEVTDSKTRPAATAWMPMPIPYTPSRGGNWILLDDYLPAIGQKVLVSSGQEVIIGTFNGKKPYAFAFKPGFTFAAVAWMPLPRPYTEHADKYGRF